MHNRYTNPDIRKIWEDIHRFQLWFHIELCLMESMAEEKLIPMHVVQLIRKKGSIPYTKKRIKIIQSIEKNVKHDVIAFLTELSYHLGEESRFVHQGITSSDIVDTGFNLQLMQASNILLNDLKSLLESLKNRAFEEKNTITIGRSHGIFGEPITFGIRLARFYAEFYRAYHRLQKARDEISTCTFSGAMGTFAHLSPVIEEKTAKKLGLRPEPIASQVIPRDRHAMFFATLAVIAGSIENVALEIRHLQRSEVREAEEFFSSDQKGSSSMPHKRNPILSENLCGLSRVIRSYAFPALENIALWHERDISHSSVERIIAPDATATLDFALKRLNHLIKNLIIYPENMKKNIENSQDLYVSQRVLLALTQKGMLREEAYKLVQKHAMQAWKECTSLKKLLESDKTLPFKKEELRILFEKASYTIYVEEIFSRVFDNKLL